MESISRETTSADSGAETPLAGDEFPWSEFPDVDQHFFGDIRWYVEQNPKSKETQLFSFLALMNSYIPESFLLKSECQTVLGPPDPIHGGPPFEERMEPFMAVIDTSSTDPEHVRIEPLFARKALAVVTNLQITRSTTVKDLMLQLCGDQAQEDTMQFVKDLLTKREMGEYGELQTFSRLIEDIQEIENVYNAISVLKTASNTMTQDSIFPQTLACLYYIKQHEYGKAEKWAKIAIDGAPNSAYMAYTLGQVYRNCLLGTTMPPRDIIPMALKAFKAFKDVEEKAEAEAEAEDSEEMNDEVSLNNRGRLGFMQVARISFEKIQRAGFSLQRHVQLYKQEVEEKFSFFEWYFTYSWPSKTSLEPFFFWQDVALCYQHYTEKKATDSTSFPGLLDYLNHGQFTSKESYARLKGVMRKTVSDLEAVCDRLKEDNADVEAAQRYILSNIILSIKTQNSSLKVAPVRELQEILHKFLGSEAVHGSPEFYLLVLMLFWPEDPERVAEVEGKEEVKWPATESNSLENITVKEPQPEEDPAQLSLGFVSDHKLPEHVVFMEQAFESAGYAKYLQGRYLLPLFFLGKGSGLDKWIHKSTLDAIVEEKVNAEGTYSWNGNSKKKWKHIRGYWSSGKVWQIPEIQEMLLPVEIEPMSSQSQGEQKRDVRVGGLKIPATAEFESDDSALRFYVGLTIKGPVVFKVEKS